MKTPRLAVLSCALVLAAGPAESHDLPDRLGKVSFPTSCDPKVQPLFDAAVAMQHSYWFPEAQKTFNTVLERDPACAIAYWGLAVNYVGNSLVAPPPPKDVEAGWNALEKARAAGAKTSANATGSRRSAPTTAITTRSRSINVWPPIARRWNA